MCKTPPGLLVPPTTSLPPRTTMLQRRGGERCTSTSAASGLLCVSFFDGAKQISVRRTKPAPRVDRPKEGDQWHGVPPREVAMAGEGVGERCRSNKVNLWSKAPVTGPKIKTIAALRSPPAPAHKTRWRRDPNDNPPNLSPHHKSSLTSHPLPSPHPPAWRRQPTTRGAQSRPGGEQNARPPRSCHWRGATARRTGPGQHLLVHIHQVAQQPARWDFAEVWPPPAGAGETEPSAVIRRSRGSIYRRTDGEPQAFVPSVMVSNPVEAPARFFAGIVDAHSVRAREMFAMPPWGMSPAEFTLAWPLDESLAVSDHPSRPQNPSPSPIPLYLSAIPGTCLPRLAVKHHRGSITGPRPPPQDERHQYSAVWR